jgi:signal transduction histidine kinase
VLETACFRIAQEAVTNVVRHARASRVRVELTAREGELRLLIRDDGTGFDLRSAQNRPADQRLGLLGMQERAAIVVGKLEIRSAPGSGTEVDIQLPLPPSRSP